MRAKKFTIDTYKWHFIIFQLNLIIIITIFSLKNKKIVPKKYYRIEAIVIWNLTLTWNNHKHLATLLSHLTYLTRPLTAKELNKGRPLRMKRSVFLRAFSQRQSLVIVGSRRRRAAGGGGRRGRRLNLFFFTLSSNCYQSSLPL